MGAWPVLALWDPRLCGPGPLDPYSLGKPRGLDAREAVGSPQTPSLLHCPHLTPHLGQGAPGEGATGGQPGTPPKKTQVQEGPRPCEGCPRTPPQTPHGLPGGTPGACQGWPRTNPLSPPGLVLDAPLQTAPVCPGSPHTSQGLARDTLPSAPPGRRCSALPLGALRPEHRTARLLAAPLLGAVRREGGGRAHRRSAGGWWGGAARPVPSGRRARGRHEAGLRPGRGRSGSGTGTDTEPGGPGRRAMRAG